MSQSANDWASPDPSKNMSLAEANQLSNQLAGGLCVQFGDRYVKTTNGNVISESELRANNYMSPLAVNLYGKLAAANAQEFNIAQFRGALRNAAVADDPTGTLVGILQAAMTGTDIASLFTRIPAVQAVIASALKKV